MRNLVSDTKADASLGPVWIHSYLHTPLPIGSKFGVGTKRRGHLAHLNPKEAGKGEEVERYLLRFAEEVDERVEGLDGFLTDGSYGVRRTVSRTRRSMRT